MSVEKKLREILQSSPYPLLECHNVSAKHAGHAGHSTHSHFELIFEGDLKSYKDMITAHKAIYHLLKPIYPSQVHSLQLFFKAHL